MFQVEIFAPAYDSFFADKAVDSAAAAAECANANHLTNVQQVGPWRFSAQNAKGHSVAMNVGRAPAPDKVPSILRNHPA